MDITDYILRLLNLDPTAKNGRQPIEVKDLGRDDLARLFNKLDYKFGAEIGVERGLFTEVLCQANPQATIYAIDAWTAYGGYREHVSQAKLDGFYEDAKSRLKGYNCKILREFSADALKGFAYGELDFVYIDANHEFGHLTDDIAEWSKRVRPGGIVAGHDFRRSKNQSYNHTVDVVQAWCYAYRIRPWFVLRGDRAASFMWIKC